MHSGQTWIEGNHVSARTPVSDVAGPHFGAHELRVRAEIAWTGIQDDELEADS